MKKTKHIKRAIYSGTFDPITKGHLNIIKRSAKIFDEVIVAVAKSSAKKPMFSLSQRKKMIKASLKNIKNSNIKVIAFEGLLVNFCYEHKANIIVRGVRSVGDFEYELQMGYANASLNKKLETIYMMPSLKYGFVSSSVVRSILNFEGSVKHLMPKKAYKIMKGLN